jgi:hypothetical protein
MRKKKREYSIMYKQYQLGIKKLQIALQVDGLVLTVAGVEFAANFF